MKKIRYLKVVKCYNRKCTCVTHKIPKHENPSSFCGDREHARDAFFKRSLGRSKYYRIFWTQHASLEIDSAGIQSPTGLLSRPSIERARRRYRGGWRGGFLLKLDLGFTGSCAFVPLAQVIRLRMREESGGEGKREGKAPMEKCPGLG